MILYNGGFKRNFMILYYVFERKGALADGTDS